MENLDQNKNLNQQEILKNKFINNNIDFKEFYKKIISLDQEGDHTKNAANNINLLENQEIKKKIENTNNLLFLRAYHNILSLSYFHKAQKEVNKNAFIKSYEEAIFSADNQYDYWLLYTEGTKVFFEKNIHRLTEIINIYPDEDENKEILIQLLLSLERNENPEESYLQVYSFKK
jgi:hypothetical protein